MKYLATALEKFVVALSEQVLGDRPYTDWFSLVPIADLAGGPLPGQSCPICLNSYDHRLAWLRSLSLPRESDQKTGLWNSPDEP